MSSLDELLKQKAKDIPEYISVVEIPEEVEAVIEKYQFKTDKNGIECLFLTLRTRDDKRIVQKYPPSTFRELTEIFEKFGGAEQLKSRYAGWEKGIIGRMQKQRLIPTTWAKRKKNE